MTNFNKELFKILLSNFYSVKKRILQNRSLSTKPTKLNEYIDELIANFNKILIYVKPFNDEIKPVNLKQLLNCRQLLIKCFVKLNCKIRIPQEDNLYILIDREIETDNKYEYEETEKDVSDSDFEDKTIDLKFEIMATVAQKTTFISTCASILRENFDGNPLSLESFIDKILLIQDLTEPVLVPTLISFVKSKLQGTARS